MLIELKLASCRLCNDFYQDQLNPSLYECEYCGKLVCLECIGSDSKHNLIDYCRCEDCDRQYQSYFGK